MSNVNLTNIFSFKGVQIIKPSHPDQVTGTLTLSHERQFAQPAVGIPEDEFLHIKFVSSSGVTELNTRLYGEQRAEKLDPCTFTIELRAPEEGALLIIFPPADQIVPREYLEFSAEGVDLQITWAQVADSFATAINQWISFSDGEAAVPAYQPSSYANEKGSSYTNEKGSSYVSEKGAGYGGSSAGGAPAPYDPSTYRDEKSEGRLVLIDEENGHEVGEVGGYQVHAIGVQPGSKEPVEVSLPEDGSGRVTVRPADYLKDALDPAYRNSTIVGTAATASRLIVTTSSYIANAIQSGADTFTKKTRPNETPLTFNPSTHNRVRQIHTLSSSAAKLSAQAVGQVSKHAQNLGARIVGRSEKGRPANPGLLNKSLVAYSTIADGIDYASKSLLASSSNAATTMVGHKYGEEAREVAYGLTGSVKNVGLVYVDASGVSRRAVVKGVAKGMVVGKVRGGGDVIVPGHNEVIDGIPKGWGDGHLGGPHAGPPSRNPSIHTPGNRSPPAPPPSYHSGNGASSGQRGDNLYFPPPPGSGGMSPQLTGSVYRSSSPGDSSLRSVSPRPFDEKADSNSNMHGGYRY